MLQAEIKTARERADDIVDKVIMRYVPVSNARRVAEELTRMLDDFEDSLWDQCNDEIREHDSR